ncbi:helix-turn-helix domain-containing protein [Chromobacterium vaccinii]|uniref:helix-turn-helix domain-containing protein n=1 Tax=Chromobacterium vaccinii TaxID=1108595 RepID=UPI003C768D02
MESLGTRLKTERLARRWTQRELARRACIGPSTIVSIESGRSRSTTKLVDIARALNLNPIYLETGKGPRTPPAPADETSLESLAAHLATRSDEELAELFRLILKLRRH